MFVSAKITEYYYASKFELLALALLVTLGGVYGSWNVALSHGVGPFVIVNVLMALTCFCYCCCASELSSTIPFPGGSFAFARCTVGYFPGFLVGCFEITYYVINLAYSNATIIYFIVAFAPSVADYSYFILLFVMVTEVALCCVSKRAMWYTFSLMAVFILGLNTAYFLASLSSLQFDKYGYSFGQFHSLYHNDDAHAMVPDIFSSQNSAFTFTYAVTSIDPNNSNTTTTLMLPLTDRSLFVGGSAISSIISILPRCYWMYLGTEFVNLYVDEVRDPTIQIPFAQIMGTLILVAHNLAIPMVMVSMFPGTDWLSTFMLPLNPSK